MIYTDGNMLQVTSRFYVIYGDSVPIYVGYTTREIQTRFEEHIRVKDFSMYRDVYVKEADLIESKIPFEIELVNKEAYKISERERQLVNQYNTSKSPFQIAEGGGQTWSDIKNYVHKHLNETISYSDITKYLKHRKLLKSNLDSFTKQLTDARIRQLNDFEHYIQDRRLGDLQSFIRNIEDPRKLEINNFMVYMMDTRRVEIGHFISHIVDYRSDYLSHFIENMIDDRRKDLNIFTSRFIDYRRQDLDIFLRVISKNNSLNTQISRFIKVL